MKYKIINTTDNKFLGMEISDDFPIMLNIDISFNPDYPPIVLGENTWRFFNSNYSIDVEGV
jgi:hypothetical protein